MSPFKYFLGQTSEETVLIMMKNYDLKNSKIKASLEIYIYFDIPFNTVHLQKWRLFLI